VLDRVKKELGVPVLTDIHEPNQAAEGGAGRRHPPSGRRSSRGRTDLLLACGRTGKTVNVKKGQFHVAAGNGARRRQDQVRRPTNNVLLTERGNVLRL